MSLNHIFNLISRCCNSLLTFKESTDHSAMTESHEGGSGGSDSKHVCMIAVFLLVKLLYLLIHSLDYLFRFI